VLDKPDLADQRVVECVWAGWGLPATDVGFLALGADAGAAVYRVDAGDRYFLKLRRGGLAEAGLAVARFLADHGVAEVIAAIPGRDGLLWTEVDGYAAVLYPFVEGRDAFECELSDRQWVAFGAALKAVHGAELPPALAADIPRQSYSPLWRSAVLRFLVVARRGAQTEPAAARLAEFLTARAEQVRHLVGRAESLARVLRDRPARLVLCHSDIHAGNVLVTRAGKLHLVDWDDAVLAPRERDLMFVGGGIGGIWRDQREEDLFYQGYGPVDVDPVALAYHRYERIVRDIAEYCQQMFRTERGAADQERSLRHCTDQFLPGNVIDIAYRTDDTLPPELKGRHE
jgi:spectinomycin phosphotransferase